jgi:luciferase family oxidoreductase group 1
LEALFPGRIDLGLGRAPGSDQRTARALRRNSPSSGDTFPEDVLELQSYFEPADPDQSLQAIPGAGAKVPIYLLGSSDFSARLAAELGLPFAFASHFAPQYLEVALALYRQHFRPSPMLDKPYAMIGVGLFVAENDAEAQRLSSSSLLQFLNMVRGHPSKLPPPVKTMDGLWSVMEKSAILERMRCAAVGSPERVRHRLADLLQLTKADEIIATAQIYDHAARLRSFELGAGILQEFVRQPSLTHRSPAAAGQ